jgi:hypothetical protein
MRIDFTLTPERIALILKQTTEYNEAIKRLCARLETSNE